MSKTAKLDPDENRPSILFINRVYPPRRASSGRLARELARSFARDGWDVQVLTTDMIASDDPDGPVRVRRILSLSRKPSIAGGLLLLLRMFVAGVTLPPAQVVVTLTDPPLLGVVGHFIARIKGAKHIHWCHDVYPDLLPVVGVRVPGFLWRLFYRLSRYAMNSADRVVVVGRCMARHLTQTGVQPQRIVLIPNWPELAMNPAIFSGAVPQPALDDAVITAAQSNIVDGGQKFRILYVGTVGFAHPVDTILDAATILDSMHPEIEFIFIGDERTQANVTGEKNRRGLGNVRVLPFQPQSRLRDIMESGDVHLISIKHEAAGMMVPAKFYAALSAARPCILVGPEATEIGRIITDYHAGSVIPQKAAQQLAQTIVDYRMREDFWFSAHDGAIKAAAAYTAEDMIRLWLRKVRELLRAN